MAAKKEATAEKAVEKNSVRIMLQKDDRNNRDALSVTVNGIDYKVERGVPVEVPPAVAEVIQHSMEQSGIVASYIDQQEKSFEQASAAGII